MNYALDQFTMTSGKVFIVQGANSLYTYQNLGNNSARIQGSNDAIQWNDIGELLASKSLIKEHSYKYLRCTGQTTVSVNRGEGNNTNDSSGGTVDAIPLTEKGQPNGVATLNSAGKVPLNQLPPITGGGNGQGFIFDDLANYTTEVALPATMEYYSQGADPILTGNTTVGSIRPGNAQSVAVGYFKTIPQTSYKMRLFPNIAIQVIATQRKIDFSHAGPGFDPITEAGGKGPVNINIGNGYIDTNVENQDIHIEFQQQTEDWLEITQTGSELIWTINGTEVVRTPQDPAEKWFYVALEPTFDDARPVPIFQYDLTGTVAELSTEVDLNALTDMVIYRSSHAFKILDKYVEVDDYVQLYEDKSKVVIYPQLSRIYDFDVTNPANLSTTPVTLHNYNPFLTLTEGTEEGKWEVGLPHQEVGFVDFSDMTPETLENFTVDMLNDIPKLTIKNDYDPEGLIEQLVAEFKIDKDWIYDVSTSRLTTGSASLINYYFYAGADRGKNYLRLSIKKYPNRVFQWSVVNDLGVESFLQETNDSSNIRMSLKNSLGILFLGGNDIADSLSETAESYTKLFDFTDTAPKITVKVTFEVEQEAINSDSWSYHRPFNGLNLIIQKMSSYNNMQPIEIIYGSGISKLKLEKQKNVGFYFVAANSLSEVCANVTNNQSNLVVGFCTIRYKPVEDLYGFTLAGPNGSQLTGEFALAPDEEPIITVNKTPNSLTINFRDQTLFSSGPIKNKLFITNIGAIFGAGIYPQQTVELDLRNIQGPSTINLESIKNRDRIRVTGGKATIHNRDVNSGDIIEFFNNKTESLITRKQSDIDVLTPLVVKDSNSNIVTTAKAYYNPSQKRITLSGRIYFSNYGYRVALTIEVPQNIRNKINYLIGVGFFGPASFSAYGLPVLTTAYGNSGLDLTLGYTGDNYVSGELFIPDATVAVSN